MRDDDGVDVLGEDVGLVPLGRVLGHDEVLDGVAVDVGEVGEASAVLVAHVHAAVQHDLLATDTDQETRPAHVLAWRDRGSISGRVRFRGLKIGKTHFTTSFFLLTCAEWSDLDGAHLEVVGDRLNSLLRVRVEVQ